MNGQERRDRFDLYYLDKDQPELDCPWHDTDGNSLIELHPENL